MSENKTPLSTTTIFLKIIKILLVLLFIVFEETVYKKIIRPIYNQFQNLNIVLHFKTWLSERENSYEVLFLFSVPFLLGEVVSIYSLKSFAVGAVISGGLLYVIKILVTIPVFIIFKEKRKTLLGFKFIRNTYILILQFKRSRFYKNVRLFIKDIGNEMSNLKNKTLVTDGKWSDELKETYQNIKKLFQNNF